VREALDAAIDREELIRRTVGGRTVVASQVVPPAVVGFNPSLPAPVVDRARARRLLAEAGYANGLELQLDGPSNRYVNDRAILAELARQLESVGIHARTNFLDKVDYFRFIDEQRSSAHLLGWSCEALDAGELFDSLLHSQSAARALGGSNSLGLADAELDGLIDAANAAVGAGERAQRLRAAMARTAELKVALPLLIQTEAVLLAQGIEWEPPPNMALQLAQIRPARAAGR
jgi:peptide/nickel transport system substrate-binding protein